MQLTLWIMAGQSSQRIVDLAMPVKHVLCSVTLVCNHFHLLVDSRYPAKGCIVAHPLQTRKICHVGQGCNTEAM